MGPYRTPVDVWSYGYVCHLIVEHLVELRCAIAGSRNLYQRCYLVHVALVYRVPFVTRRVVVEMSGTHLKSCGTEKHGV